MRLLLLQKPDSRRVGKVIGRRLVVMLHYEQKGVVVAAVSNPWPSNDFFLPT